MDAEREAPQECGVQAFARVGCEDGEAVKTLHALKQIADLEVCVTVVRILHFGALTEQCVGLVEEQHGVALRRRTEDRLKVLLGLANVLAHDGRQLNPEQVEAQLCGDDLGSHGLARSRRTAKERGYSCAVSKLLLERPVLQHPVAVDELVAYLAELRDGVLREHEVIPTPRGLDAHREPVKRRACLRSSTLEKTFDEVALQTTTACCRHP